MRIRSRFTVAVLTTALLAAILATPPSGASAARPALASVTTPAPDPGQPGPLATNVSIYDFGDSALTFPGFPGPVEDRAVVWRPANLSGGPFPFVLLLHGRHQVCVSDFAWPCPAGDERVRSYRGYDEMARNLASHGFIVASISANGINAADGELDDGGADARGRLILHHLDRWKMWNTTGGAPYGTTFVGKVDLNRIGLMGHSRGGEGVAYAVQRNQALGSPYGIKAAMLIGPVDFTRRRLHRVNLGVILPYCDGDVADLQGVHYVDDTLYEQASDPAYRNTVLVEGANHNYFNSEWTPPAKTGGDDAGFVGGFCDAHAPGNGRLKAAAERLVGTAYVNGFMRLYVTGETALAPLFDGSRTRPPSIAGAHVLIGYHPPSTGGQRLDLDRFRYRSDQYHDNLGGEVTYRNLFRYLCGGPPPQASSCAENAPLQDPHSGDPFGGAPGLTRLAVGWGNTHGSVQFDVAADRGDVSRYKALVFRAGVDWSKQANVVGRLQDVRVAITDNTGKTVLVPAGRHSNALRYPAGTDAAADFALVPKLVMNTVRLPLSAFAEIDLTHVVRVLFLFDRSQTGGVDVANIAFADRN